MSSRYRLASLERVQGIMPRGASRLPVDRPILFVERPQTFDVLPGVELPHALEVKMPHAGISPRSAITVREGDKDRVTMSPESLR